MMITNKQIYKQINKQLLLFN